MSETQRGSAVAAKADGASSGPVLRVQRSCACGTKAPGLSGECGECQSKKLLGLQAKLQIGEVNDRYEQEADRAADQVMQGAAADRAAAVQAPLRIQRLPEGTCAGVHAPAVVTDTLASPGRPLESGTRSFFESRFGHDFSRVRVHDDSGADRSARSVGARAYTVGSHVAFAAGQYAPDSATGRRLIAHELTHTLQQAGAPRLQRAPWGQCPQGKEVDARGWIRKGLTREAVLGAASAFKIYAVAEAAAVAYYKFHPMNAGHCVVTNEELAAGRVPDNCRGQDRRTAELLMGQFHRDHLRRGPSVKPLDPNTVERVESFGGAVRESIAAAAVLQPDILDISAREVYDVTTSKESGKKWIKIFLTYTQRLTDATDGLPWKAGTRPLGPGPLGGMVKQGNYKICYLGTDFEVAPGVIQYVAIEDDQGTNSKKQKKDKPKDKKPAEKKAPDKKKPDGKKPATKGGNVGFGLGLGSTGSGSGNAVIGVSLISGGVSYATVSGGIIYDSHGTAVGTVGMSVASRSDSTAALSAGAGAADKGGSEALASASVGAAPGASSTQIASATKGGSPSSGEVQVGKVGNSTDAGVAGTGAAEPGAESRSADTPTAPSGVLDGGTATGSGGPGDAGVNRPGLGGKGKGKDKDQGEAAASSQGEGAPGGSSSVKPLIDVPGLSSTEVDAAINEAAAIDERLKSASPARREFLDRMAGMEGDPETRIPGAAWVQRMLAITEGLSDPELERLGDISWSPGDAPIDEARERMKEALAQPAAQGAEQPAEQAAEKPDDKAESVTGTIPIDQKRKDKPDSLPADQIARLAARARAFPSWAQVAASPAKVQILYDDKAPLGVPVGIEVYIVARDDKGRLIRATGDATATITRSGSGKKVVLHANSPLVDESGTYWPQAHLRPGPYELLE